MSSEEILYNAGAEAIGAGYSIFCLVLVAVILIGMWKVFAKAGKPGWAAIVPFYNFYCLCDMAFGNGWLFFIFIVPCVGTIFQMICLFKLAKAFGKGAGFGLGLAFLTFIFIPILGFGDAEYIGPQ